MGIGRNAVTKIVGTPLPSGIQGDVLYHNGSNWVVLNPGTANQVLTTNGSSVNPSWTNKTSATGVVAGTDKMVQFNDGGSDFGGEANFLYFKNSANLTISGSSGYALSTYASSSAQSASGIDVWDYDKVQKLQVGYNNLSNESYIWATTTSNNLKFGTDGTKRMEILASNGKVLTSNDLHVSGTLTADTNTLVGTDTLWTQKGDLVVGTGSDTAQRLASAAGDNGQVLTIDTGETTGLKWADPGGVEIIANYHVPVASASTGTTGSRYVSSPIRIDPVGGDWEDGNVVITDDPGIGTVSTTGLGKLSLISQTGSSMLGVAASGAATTIAKFGSITNHTSTLEFIHNGYNASDILSKIVMTSGTTTIGATGTHKFILTGGLGITAASSKPADSVTKPVLWVSGTSNALFLGDRQMVTAGSSALTAGYVPYVSSSAKHGLGNSVLYNDSTNSRIGINTASPNRAFDVRGTSLLSGNTKVVGTGEITSTLDVGTNITGTGTATFKTATLNNIVLDPSNRAAFIKLQDSSRTTTTASRNPELLLNQILIDSGSDKADFPTIRFTKAGPVDISSSYTNLGYRIYVSGETGAGTVDAPQAMIWDFNSDTSDPLNYTEKLALTTAGGLRINNAYTLPTAAPASNGYVITGATDGTTAWVANSGGGGGGTISGSIADNQIAIGASASDSIEGSANLTYDANDIKLGTADTNQNIYLEIAASGAGYTAAGIKLLTYNGANRPGGVYSYNHANTAGWYSGPLYGTSFKWGISYKSSLTDTDGSLESTADDGNAVLQIGTDGKVGIGDVSAGSKLHISGNTDYNNTGGIRLGTTSTYASIYINNSSGGLEIDSPHSMILDANRHMEFHAGGTTREHRFMYATTQYGFMTTADANTYWAIGNKSIASAGLLLSGAAGGIRMVPADGNVTVVGTISATAKSFDIPHPDKEGMRLIHGSLEGPEHGVYVRGTAKGHGDTTIELPDYWKTLVGNDYTLQLTSYNSSNVYIIEKDETSFTIGSNSLNYKFDYFVIGKREEIEVEIDGN